MKRLMLPILVSTVFFASFSAIAAAPKPYTAFNCAERGPYGPICSLKFRTERAAKPFDCLMLGLPGSGGGLQGISDYHTDFADAMNCATASIANGMAIAGSTEASLERTLDSYLKFDTTNHPELKKAPIFTFGWSLGSIMGIEGAAKYNERLIAASGGSGNFYWKLEHVDNPVGCCRYRCTPDRVRCPILPTLFDADAVFVNGEKDNNSSTSLKAAQDNLKIARQSGLGRGALAIAWGETHLNPTWDPKQTHVADDFIYLYLYDLWNGRKAAGATVSAEGYIKYAKIPLQSGWLAETQDFSGAHGKPVNATKADLEIAPYAQFRGDKSMSSWMPSERTARAYRAMNIKQENTLSIVGLKKQVSYTADELVSFEVVGAESPTIYVGDNATLCTKPLCSFRPNQIGGGVIPIVAIADGKQTFRAIVAVNNPEIKAPEFSIVTVTVGRGLRVSSPELRIENKILLLGDRPVSKLFFVRNGKIDAGRSPTQWGWQPWQIQKIMQPGATTVGMRLEMADGSVIMREQKL